MRFKFMTSVAAVAMLPALWAQAAKAPVKASAASAKAAPVPGKSAPGDWPMYAHDLGSTRYSTLTQINTRNVASLTKAWSYKLSAGGSEATPIVVGGTMY